MVNKVTLASLAKQMERGFGAIAADITDIRTTMPTKDDVRAILREETQDIRTDVGSIHRELADIRRDLKELTGKVDNLSGLPKEIDHTIERTRRIETHLGIEADIAA